MGATRQEVYAAIDTERAYQDGLWPGRQAGGPNELTVGEFLLMIEEYAAKARAEWVAEKSRKEKRSMSFGRSPYRCELHGAARRAPTQAVVRSAVHKTQSRAHAHGFL